MFKTDPSAVFAKQFIKAIKKHDYSKFDALLGSNQEISKQDMEHCLLIASSVGNDHAFKGLIKRGADPTIAMDQHGNLSSHVAAFIGDINMLRVALTAGKISPKAQNNYGQTIAHLAARHSDVIEILAIKYPEIFEIRDTFKRHPMEYARSTLMGNSMSLEIMRKYHVMPGESNIGSGTGLRSRTDAPGTMIVGGRLDFSSSDMAFNAMMNGDVEGFKSAMKNVKDLNLPITHFQHIVMLGKKRREFIDAALGMGMDPDEENVHKTSVMDFAVSYMLDDIEYFSKLMNASQRPLRSMKLIAKEMARTTEELNRETNAKGRERLSKKLEQLKAIRKVTQERYDSNPELFSVTEGDTEHAGSGSKPNGMSQEEAARLIRLSMQSN